MFFESFHTWTKKNGIAKGQIAIDKFILACRNGNKNLLLSKLFSSGEVDANAISEEGKTILTVSIMQRHIPAMQLLLQHGADVNHSSHVYYHRDHISPNIWSYDEAPLLTAARLNCTSMVHMLLGFGADVSSQNECRPPQGVDTLKDRTALHFAAEHGNAEMVMALLEHGCDANTPDKQGELPIHLAVRCRNTTCSSQRKIVQMLHEYGSKVNTPNKIGCVPLYLAAFYGCVLKASILIQYGADIDHCCNRDNSYVTSLHIAASKDRLPLAKLLVENNAKLNLVNTLGYTPLQLNVNALCKSDIASLLIYHGAELTGRDRYGLTLMGSVIRNLRLDCEYLAQLLVLAGYDLNNDLWLLPEDLKASWKNLDADTGMDSNSSVVAGNVDVPIPLGRVQALCDWLRERQQDPRSLLEVCRVKVRQYLGQVNGGRSVIRSISQLPLPTALLQYLMLIDIYDTDT